MDELKGPKYQLDRAMAEEGFLAAVKGPVRCSLCPKEASIILRAPLTIEQAGRLGTDHRTVTFTFLSLCIDCMGLPDIEDRLNAAVERNINDKGRPIYDLGDLDPPPFLR